MHEDAHDKAGWRRLLRARLVRLDDPERQARRLREGLATFLARHAGARTASFAHLPGEPDLLPLLDELPELHWCFPRVASDGELHLHRVRGTADLRPGAFGILEPDARSPTLAAGEIDLVLCPGLGFDRHGTRLGRGRGFYDRFLARLRPQVPRIGVAFPCQLAERLPRDAHDIPMSHLATPEGVREIAPPPGSSTPPAG